MKTDNKINRNNGTELIRLIEKAISCCRWKANFAFSNTSDYRKWKEKKKILIRKKISYYQLSKI